MTINSGCQLLHYFYSISSIFSGVAKIILIKLIELELSIMLINVRKCCSSWTDSSVYWSFVFLSYLNAINKFFVGGDLLILYQPPLAIMPTRWCISAFCPERHGEYLFSWPKDPSVAQKWNKFLSEEKTHFKLNKQPAPV